MAYKPPKKWLSSIMKNGYKMAVLGYIPK